MRGQGPEHRGRPGTFINEFRGASDTDIKARPEVSELGSRNATLWIFAGLIAGAIAVAAGAVVAFPEQAGALYESVFGAPFGGAEEASTTGTTGDDTGTTGDTDTGSDTTGEPPPPPPPPKGLTPGELTITGQVAREEVVEVFGAARGELEDCQEKARSAGKDAVGRIEVSFSFKSGRKASSVKEKVIDGALDKNMRACIKKVITRAKWPKPAKGTARVTQVMQFD